MGNIMHFGLTNGYCCESVKDLETENVSTWGGLEPPTFGFMLNAATTWAIRARHLLSHVFEYCLWLYRYFWRKVNIWNVKCAWATALIFDPPMDVLVKVSPLTQVLVCCLMAPSHHMDLCWFIISDNHFREMSQGIRHQSLELTWKWII